MTLYGVDGQTLAAMFCEMNMSDELPRLMVLPTCSGAKTETDQAAAIAQGSS